MADSDPDSEACSRLAPIVDLSGVWDVSAAQLLIDPYCQALAGTTAPAAVQSLLDVALQDYRQRLLRDLLLTDIERACRGSGVAVADLRASYEARFPGDLAVIDDCFRSEVLADLA